MVCVYQTLHTMCSFAIHVHTNSRCPSKIPLHESSSTLWAWYTCNIGRYHISHRPFRTFRTCFADVSRASHRLFRTFRTRFATFRACFAHVSRMSHKVFRTFRACFAHVSHQWPRRCTSTLASTHGLDAGLPEATDKWVKTSLKTLGRFVPSL